VPAAEDQVLLSVEYGDIGQALALVLAGALSAVELPWPAVSLALAGSVLLGFAIACVARRYSGEPGTQASAAAAFVLIAPGFLPFAAGWVQTFPAAGPAPRGLSSTTFWWLAGTACLAAIAASVPELRRLRSR
jgi:hypothetical protein